MSIADDYPILVIPAGHKEPDFQNWQNHPGASPKAVEFAIQSGQNLGIILGRNAIDLEVDGEGGEDSLAKLFGGTVPETTAWVSKRGKHRLFQMDGRLADITLSHSPDYPGLEFRLKGQSICPPSVVDDFKRRWTCQSKAAPLPEDVIQRIIEAAGSSSQPTPELKIWGNAQDEKLAELQVWANRFDVPLQPEHTTNKDGAYVLKFDYCPLRGHEDGGAVLYINEDGSHVFNCKHAKCVGKKFIDLEKRFGPFDPPEIKIGPDLHRMEDDAFHALRRADLYDRGNVIVEMVYESRQPKLSTHDNGAPRLRIVPEHSMSSLLSKHARWIKLARTEDGEWERIPKPPVDKVVKIVAAAADLRKIPPINGVVSAPMLRSDGTIAASPGYDKQTGLYLDIAGDWPTLMPSRYAIEALDDILHDFPFEAPAHKSAWIAALVTLLTRHAFAGSSPLFLFDANTSRVGKGLLTDVLAMLLQGRKANRWDYSQDDAEMRKVITSVAMAGMPYVLWDNVKGTLGGKSLEAVITAGRWSDRILGSQKTVDIPVTFVPLATGNNAAMTFDMVGRVVVCRLCTPLESPGTRTDFRHADLLAHVKEHRRELVMAALSIPAAYIAAGRPKPVINAWGGFEGWNDLVRASLLHAGLPDFDMRSELADEADTDSMILRQLIDAWPPGEWKLTQLVTAVYETDDYPEIKEVLAEVKGDAVQALSYLLRDARGRVISGKRFIRSGGKNGRRWSVETVTAAA